MKISYWIDYNCPYSYLGIKRLNDAINELKYDDIKIDVHSYELDVNAPKECTSTTLDRYVEKYNMTSDDAKKEINKISKLAITDGLDINYESVKFTNTHDAHRLTKLAIENNNQKIILKLCNLLFDAYFSKNYVLSNHDVLLKIGIAAGLSEEKITQVLNSDKFHKEVKLDEQVAKESGINGTPYFIFNNKHAIPGVLPTSEFINVLRKIKFEEEIQKEYQQKQS